jgi:hypothetical protein
VELLAAITRIREERFLLYQSQRHVDPIREHQKKIIKKTNRQTFRFFFGQLLRATNHKLASR